jgi:hypothetical protein
MNTQKADAPFSEFVTPYYKTHPDNMHLNIHYGPDAIKRAERDANDYKAYGYTPSLCLPESGEYKNYWWPVKDLTIVLNWNCEDTELQIDFANYLTHVCKAHRVFTLLDGIDTLFMDTRRMVA